MKKSRKIGSLIFTVLGFLLLLLSLPVYVRGGNILNFELGTVDFLIDKGMAVIVICVTGVVLVTIGTCGLFVKKSKQEEIEEKDERNIIIANMAKSSSYEVMTVLYSIVTVILGLTGAINNFAFFALALVFVISQIVFVSRLYYLQKKCSTKWERTISITQQPFSVQYFPR